MSMHLPVMPNSLNFAAQPSTPSFNNGCTMVSPNPSARSSYPDLDVIHVCLDLPTALAELPQLFSPMPTNTSTGETTNPTATPLARSSPPSPPLPASGVGSNSTHLRPSSATPRPTKRPQAVLFSHKFTRDEAHAVTDDVLGATGGPYYTTHLLLPPQGGGASPCLDKG
ncbi:predicted protein [Chaetomium globosum CBS 148.51]|uniref:Uncharacterized protein n=1 Tax=Chaetomium globosum (strain ATCC 6205 / CBS 148.51 / DSM 1962 / NBRC 6347 / NRRL 1970) TaxID=306901 RepID=Q2GXD9_CHAGB|nr:uncharacterized protein CHGG_07365 [Chaetomium globosum CBS 148.51]EAQ86112.1 predicted protein [Chaetomium globosum CBS 148.51]